MKPTDDFLSDEALDDVAAEWLCERDEGFAPGRAHSFAAWRDRDPRHAAAVIRVEHALERIHEMPAARAPLESRFGRTSAIPENRSAHGGRRLRFSLPFSIAALAAALVVGAIAWWTVPPRFPTAEHYASEGASQRRVALRDGSVVDLNRASDVRVEFTARERRVNLGAGEAHFQVAPDTARPFVVTAGGVSVRAVGTAFTVRVADGSVDVLVVEGKVEVVRDETAHTASPAPRSLVAAGETTHVSRDPATPPKVEKAAPEVIRAALVWQDPMMTFNDVALREVVTRLNQRNVTQLVLDDPLLGGRKVGGVIALDQVEAFVRLLEQDGDVVSERLSPDKIVLRRVR